MTVSMTSQVLAGDRSRLFTPSSLASLPRELGRRIDDPRGACLLVVAGLHGNEPAGVTALGRVFAALEVASAPLRGGLVAFAGNRGALAAGARFLDRDLNRMWTSETLRRAHAGELAEPEAAELVELDGAVSRTLAEATGRVYFLDLHSTSGGGPPFVVLDDALPSRRLALAFPVPLVLGLEEQLAGTLVFQTTARGIIGFAFEAGRHEDPATVDRAEAAVWLALASTGILPRTLTARAERARRFLRSSRGASPHLAEVLYRHRIAAEDEFRMEPGWSNFDRVRAGELLAHDRRGPVVAPRDGRLLMPLYQTRGEDGFFIVEPIRRFWFELSATLRRLHADRLLPLLPGVRRARELPDAFVVSRRIARWLVPEVFHLLGYTRLDAGPGHFLFRRRAADQA